MTAKRRTRPPGVPLLGVPLLSIALLLLPSAPAGLSGPAGPAAGAGGPGGPGAGYFVVDVSGERFIAFIRDPEVADQARAMIARIEPQRILNGALKRGSGGFNYYGKTCYPWHMDPGDIHFTGNAIELCDGIPSMVSADVDYWVKTVGHYCPWTTFLVEEIEKPRHPHPCESEA